MPSVLRRLFRRDKPPFRKEPARVAPPAAVVSNAGSWYETKRKRHDPVGLARDFYRDPAQIAKVEERLRPLLAEPDVVAAIDRDEVPIPAAADREGYYGDRHLNYWLSGLDDLRAVRTLAPGAALTNVLDFGGASGRFARHVALTEPPASVTVAELSLNHVLWCNEHFGPTVRAMRVSQYCHFPLADRSISLCVGLSVFTHIDDFETGWLAELHRVLDDGGFAFLTIHSEHTWPLLQDKPALLAMLQHDPAFVAAYDPTAPLPAERMVFHHRPDTIYHCCNTFVHTDYVRRVWSKWFEIVGIYPQAHHDFQTAVVLRKR
jgi:SAM-dependent methyltransferase